MKSIIFLLSVLIFVAFAKQTKNHNSGHGGTILTHSRHNHADFGRHEADTQESSHREKSFEDYKAELQDYLDLEKENEAGLEDDAELMENSNDDDDDAEMMKNSDDDDDDDDAEMMEKNRGGDDEKMGKHDSSNVKMMKHVNYNDAETMKKDDVVKLMGDDDGDDTDEEIEAMDEGDKTSRGENKKFVIEMDKPPPLKGRSKLVKSQWCRCNSWKRAYYRERHYKNYYYRLYIAYYRHYRKYYKKYIAYYRHYRRCHHKYRTCQRKYHRLRQGYKNMVKSHSHLLKTCKYRG